MSNTTTNTTTHTVSYTTREDSLTAALATINQARRIKGEEPVTKLSEFAKSVIYAVADAETEQYWLTAHAGNDYTRTYHETSRDY